VLRLFSRLNVGGPSIHVVVLTSGLAERGYETRLLVGSEGEREGNMFALADQHGVACVRVVHTFHGHVLRGYFGPAKTTLYRALERWLGAASSALIAVSDAVKADLVELGVAPPSKIRVIRLGLPLETLAGALPRGVLRREAGVPEAATLVGIVGRLAPIKDVGVFLEAAARVHRANAAVHFAIVGDGELRQELEAHAGRLGLQAHVHFYGWRSDMAGVYGDLDLVVNCSRNEGTPVALIEALAAARPVVATRVGGTPDVLKQGEYGTLVMAGDPGALAEAILRALDGTAARAQALAAQRAMLGTHSTGRLVADIDGLYRELLTGAKTA
jgi:glycosyltransferase involved in cell wall biosynthesis